MLSTRTSEPEFDAMDGQSIFREDLVRKLALEVRDKIVKELEGREDQEEVERIVPMKSLNGFKASSHWFQKFMRRRKFKSMKPRGELRFLDADAVAGPQDNFRRLLCTWAVQELANTDEVGVLYRCFPSRTVCTSNAPTAYKRIKDSLTAVLTVYADGRKDPLVIIGKS